LSGPIRHGENQFLPHLKTKSQAAIVNVSSGLAFVPLPFHRFIAPPRPVCIHSPSLFRVQLKKHQSEGI